MQIVVFDIGFVNLVCAVIERQEFLPPKFKIVTWEKWNIGSPATLTEILVDRLLSRLEEEAKTGKFDNVEATIIERQMVVKLTVLVHTIQAFFTMREYCLPGNIYIQHGTSKNKCGEILKRAGLCYAERGLAKYTVYKQRAIFDAGQALHLQDDESWVTFFHGETKKDDLADALMHGIWFLFGRI
jgi:hypothetical protein